MKNLWHMRGITNALNVRRNHAYDPEAGPVFYDNYCLFLDYDGLEFEKVRDDVGKLVDRFPQLTTIWIVETKKNHFWVLSFGEYTRQEVLDMMVHSNCDHDYFKCFKVYGCNTIRLTQKPGQFAAMKLRLLLHRQSYKHVSLQHTIRFENTFKVQDFANPSSGRKDCGLQVADYWVPAMRRNRPRKPPGPRGNQNATS